MIRSFSSSFQLSVIGGPYGNGSPPNGQYTVNNPRRRTDASGMIRDGYGFSLDLNPTFPTNRSLLRIHPDGNNAGTLGCVGLQVPATSLRIFYSTMRTYINAHGNINMNININIEGNPDNQGGAAAVPNFNE